MKAVRDIKHEDTPPKETTKKTPKKMSKRKIILLSMLAVLLAVIVAAGLWILLSEPEIDVSANPFSSNFMELFGNDEAYSFVNGHRKDRNRSMGTIYRLEDFFGRGLFVGETNPDDIIRNKNAYNILVVGKDRVGSNTDVIMVVNFDSLTQKVNILQIPRDTYVEDPINKYSSKRINAIFAFANNAYRKKYETREEITHASLKYLESTVESTFGITIDNYFMIDLNGFVKIIDSIGGVEVNVPFNMNYSDPEQNLYINLKKGVQTLNGNQAEQFVRFRNTYVLGDLGRVSAQKIFLAALVDKLTSPEWFSVDSLTSVASNLMKYTTSGMTLTDLVGFITKIDFGKFSSDSITFYTAQGEGYFSSSGASFYSLYLEENLEIINKAFNLYNKEVTADNVTLSEQYRSASTEIDIDGSTASEIEEEPPKIIVAGGGSSKPKPKPPVEEAPSTGDEPVIDEPVVDEPVIDEPVIDEPVIDEPTVDEPPVDEPTVDEPTVDEPTVDEPTVDEPTVDEPIVDEPIVDEPIVEEPKQEEPEDEYIAVASPNQLS